MGRKAGFHQSAETKAKISLKNRDRCCTTETRARLSMALRGRKLSSEWCDKISKTNKGLKLTDVQYQRFVIAMRERWRDPEFVLKMTAQRNTLEYRDNMSKKIKDKFKDPEYRKRILHRRQMSGPESVFATICRQYGFEYKFVGNGELWLGNRNPDFVHISKKHLVEIWGDYFHRGQDPQKRIDHFKQFGYACLIIWASELCQVDMVVDKVRRCS